MLNATNAPTSATAEDIEAARTLGRDVVGRAIGRYHEAADDARRALELEELDPRLSRWAELAVSIAGDAATDLLRAILATSPGFGVHPLSGCERWRWPARGIECEGTLYLAIPDPERDGAPGGPSGPAIMQLRVVDRSAIVGLADLLDLADVGAGPAPAVRADPAPAWVVDLMTAVDQLGDVESMRRVFGPTTGRTSTPEWRELVLSRLKELGRGEASRRVFRLGDRPGSR